MFQIALQQGIKAARQAPTIPPLPPVKQASHPKSIAQGKELDVYNWAKLCGWAGVERTDQLPPLWTGWVSTTSRDTQHDHLIRRMRQWSIAINYPVNPTIEFFKQAMEDFVNLRLNPGEYVPTFKNAYKGMSGLLCMPTSDSQRMSRRSRNQAYEQTHPNMTLADNLKFQASDPPAPPKTYEELTLATATYATLVWAICGERCDHYIKLKALWDMLEHPAVFV